DQAVRLWDAASGKEIHRFRGHAGGVWSVAFSPDGKQVLTGSWDKAARLWDAASGKEIRAFLGHIGAVLSVAFSPDGKQVLTGGSDKTARLWDAASGKEIRTFRGHTDSVRSVAVSPGGKQVLTGSHDNTARLWDVASGKEIRTFRGHTDWVRSVAVSPDGKQVLTGSEDETARLWDAASGKEIRTFHTDHVYSVAFSPDGKQVLAGGFDQAVRLWDAASGTEIRTFRGDAGSVKLVAFSPDGKRLLTAHAEGRTILWDAASGVELCSLVSFADGDWAVVDPQGRFDAANGGNVEGLHWVIGNEPIDLFQLKERYYEPGLLAKKMGFNHEPLRNVARLDNPKLYPGIELRPPTPGDPQLHVELSNRGGGIGRVVVRINGKELTADARGPGHDPDARALTLEVPLPPDQPLLTPGQPNRIVVEAYNAEGYLHSRGLELNYEPPAARPPEKPHLWIVVSGVSSYRGPSLELRFAAKDAEDFARAAEIGARRLFDRDRVHLALLTSSQADPKRRPTCDNLRAAFADIRAAGAKSTDILVVYLAGHGVNYGGQDGDFYYLTADAQSADLSDPAVREGAALSGQQITELINGIPALKQVLVLDTCASGRLIEKLTEKRDIPTSQIRALERLKDRTGMHVLAGCAADSVSYEATRYGQGVLTYSLLLGMRGAALREDQFVDVATLFGFATDKVPKLAGDIGGIQRPLLAVPKGGASFDIGQLSGEDRQQIPLQPARPLVLRSTFQDEETFDDALGLSKRVDELLRGVSVRGSAGAVVFVDARELPEGYHLNGLYKTEGGQATLRARLFRGRERAAEFTLAAERPDELAERVVEAVEKWFRNGGAR
ncbi:MAG TPA: caspase family protein, partial [Pirellulales bacterium]